MNKPEKPVKVLLVDDDISLRGITSSSLRKAGFETSVAQDGEEALKLALTDIPDVIISDIMMPRMNGMDLLNCIRTEDVLKNCYVILLTAKDRASDMADGFKAMADDYLTKPFKVAELIMRVKAGSRLKLAQDHLRESNEQLREALCQRSELLGIAAHDLRNPISIITTYISLLGQGIVSDESIKEVCLRRAEGLAELMDNMLDISKIDAGQVTLEPEDVNFALIARESVTLYEPAAQQREIKLTLASEDKISVFCDRTRLGEMLNTLIEVGIRISPDGGEIDCDLGLNGNSAAFVLTIRKTVIPNDIASLMFDPTAIGGFSERLDANTIIGLSIIGKLVDMMEGATIAKQAGDNGGIKLGFSLPAVM